MSKICKIKDILIGDGIPKVCVSVVSDNHQAIITDIIRLMDYDIDIIDDDVFEVNLFDSCIDDGCQWHMHDIIQFKVNEIM